MPITRSNLSIPLTHLSRIDNDSEMETDEKQRKETQFRPLCVKCGVFGAQNGSGYAEFGNTRVLAQINGPESDGKWEGESAKITITLKGVQSDVKLAEYRAELTSSVKSVVFLNKYPGKVIEVDVNVISDDGGVLATAMTAVTLALAHSGIQHMGMTATCHVGMRSDGTFMTDPSSSESLSLVGGLTFGFVPNLSQTTCVDLYGQIPSDRISALLEFAKLRSISLVPVLHKAVVNSVQEKK